MSVACQSLTLGLFVCAQDLRKVEEGEILLEESPFELEEAIADARLFSLVTHKKNISFVRTRDIHATLMLCFSPSSAHTSFRPPL